jgi:SAM-dependent methyltransferase
MTDLQEMWEQRARARGHLGVVPSGWDDEKHDLETQRAWKRIGHHVLHRGMPGALALDFGCGAGRFTRLLNAHHATTGTDRSVVMGAQYAERVPHRPFLLIEDGKIPAPSDTFGVLWTFTVLQHVPDAEFAATIAEIRRVLSPGALVVMTENTHENPNRVSRSGHMTFRDRAEYLTAFPGVLLMDTFDIVGERHDVFVGELA